MQSDSIDHLPFDAGPLIRAAVAEAVSHEDPERFFTWLRDHLQEYLRPDYEDGDIGNLGAFTAVFGRHLWNAIPLPGNGLKPRPLPAPRRNDPCPCGSGRKYKRCCQGLQGPELDPETLYPFVAEALPEERLRALIAEGAPAGFALGVAAMHAEADRPKKAAGYLEPLFEGRPARTDAQAAEALLMLLDLYEDLGYTRKKRDLLDHITATAPRSPLRAEAWQRLATIESDAGRHELAREAFERAMRDVPDDPSLAPLEVILLIAEEEMAKAQERARYWLRRLERKGYDTEDPAFALLRSAAEDPRKAIAAAASGGFAEPDDRLTQLAAEAAARSLPDGYQLEEHEAEGGSGATLVEPHALDDVADAWWEVFRLDKPFSVQPTPFDDEEVWEADVQAQWLGFLAEHPVAFDSIDILDDIVAALYLHPAGAWPDVRDQVTIPLLERAAAILERAVAAHPPGVHLPWFDEDNRPALRCLFRLYEQYELADRPAEARFVAERYLALNPADNHGARAIVMDSLLADGRDAEAVALAEGYPDDMFPETTYGRALALYRLGRRDEADAILVAAIERLPKVADFLTRKKVRRPKLDEHGVRIGGDDQAWLYRQDALELWRVTPGALEWLASSV